MAQEASSMTTAAIDALRSHASSLITTLVRSYRVPEPTSNAAANYWRNQPRLLQPMSGLDPTLGESLTELNHRLGRVLWSIGPAIAEIDTIQTIIQKLTPVIDTGVYSVRVGQDFVVGCYDIMTRLYGFAMEHPEEVRTAGTLFVGYNGKKILSLMLALMVGIVTLIFLTRKQTTVIHNHYHGAERVELVEEDTPPPPYQPNSEGIIGKDDAFLISPYTQIEITRLLGRFLDELDNLSAASVL